MKPPKCDAQTRKEIKAFYNDLARQSIEKGVLNPFYKLSDPFFMHGHVQTAKIVLSKCEGEKILDAGCGPGFYLNLLKNKNFNLIIGLDLTHKFLSIAKAAKNDKINLFNSCIENIPFNKDTFDTVICLGVLEHLTDPIEGLKELTRVLKKRGNLIILVPNHSSLANKLYSVYQRISWKKDQPEQQLSWAKIVSIMASDQTGLTNIEILGQHYYMLLTALYKVFPQIVLRCIPLFDFVEKHELHFLKMLLAPELLLLANKKQFNSP